MRTTPESYVLLDWINKDKLKWGRLSTNPNAIDFLKKNPSKIDWSWLSGSPNAIELLENNRRKIDWVQLSCNPNAISLLEKNLKNINWNLLSRNPNALSLLEKCPEKGEVYWLKVTQIANYQHIFKWQISRFN